MKKRLMMMIKILLVCCIALGAYQIGASEGGRKKWLDLRSPDGNYAITVDIIGEPFIYAPGKVEVFCEELKGEEVNVIKYFRTYISNLGGDLTELNYNIEWKEGGAILTFKGDKQKPITYIIEWDKVFQ